MAETTARSAPKAQIVVVSLNPAFDLILQVDDFRPGVHQQARQLQCLPAGKGLNVSRTFDSLGLGSIITGFVGQDSMSEFERALEDTRITGQFFAVAGHTRQNITIIDPANASDTHIRQQGLELSEQDVERMGKKLSLLAEPEVVVVFSGSLPPGMNPADLARLLRICKEDRAKTVVDSSGQALPAVVKEGAWFIKPNREEFAELTSQSEQSIEQMARAARKLNHQVENVLISLGRQGAMLVSKELAIQAIPANPKSSPTLNTVGSGDSLLGAFLAYLVQGEDMQSCLKHAVAVSWAACQTPTPASFDPQIAEQLHGQVRLQQVNGL